MNNDTPPDWMTDEWLREAVAWKGSQIWPALSREILRLRAEVERITAENLEGGQEIRAVNTENAKLRAVLSDRENKIRYLEEKVASKDHALDAVRDGSVSHTVLRVIRDKLTSAGYKVDGTAVSVLDSVEAVLAQLSDYKLKVSDFERCNADLRQDNAALSRKLDQATAQKPLNLQSLAMDMQELATRIQTRLCQSNRKDKQ